MLVIWSHTLSPYLEYRLDALQGIFFHKEKTKALMIMDQCLNNHECERENNIASSILLAFELLVSKNKFPFIPTTVS